MPNQYHILLRYYRVEFTNAVLLYLAFSWRCLQVQRSLEQLIHSSVSASFVSVNTSRILAPTHTYTRVLHGITPEQ